MGFKYLNKEQDIFDGDDGEDVYANEEQLQARLAYFEGIQKQREFIDILFLKHLKIIEII